MWFEYMLGVLDITVDCVPRLLPLDGEITVYKDHSAPPEGKVCGGLAEGTVTGGRGKDLPCS